MNVVELRAQLESEASWRDGELRHLRNSLISAGLDSGDITYCRTVLVMTYAHLEGFVKQALTIYVAMINAERLTAHDLASPLAASTLRAHLRGLHGGGSGSSPDQAGLEMRLQRQAERETQLLIDIRDHERKVAVLDAEDLATTDSNLSPAVLRRNLYRLGLDPDALAKHHGDMMFLLRTRNDVAHGSRSEAIHPRKFEAAVASARAVMNELPPLLYNACRWGQYRS